MATGSTSPPGWKVWPDPGGIIISRTAFDQIEDKLPLGYEYIGEKSFKKYFQTGAGLPGGGGAR